MNIQRRPGQQGFTLTEALVAVTIIGISLGACCLSFSLAMRAVSTSANQMDSLQDARNQIELLRTYSFTNATYLTAGTYIISNNPYYRGNYVVSNVDSWTKDITVNIVYQNRLRGGYSTNTLFSSITKTLHK
jgi:prepilin-type N-terminal cleavage/methylation domain-containing protein